MPRRIAAPECTIRQHSICSVRELFRNPRFWIGRRSQSRGRMTQIFSPSADTWLRLFSVGGLAALAGGVAVWIAFARSDYYTGANMHPPAQPVPFSHKHHAGDLGIDCQYCHTSVADGPHAGLPPTHTCMTCHSQIWTNASMLEPVRESLAADKPLAVASRRAAAGLRLFPPRRSHRQGRRLRDLPRARRPDASDLPGRRSEDGILPQIAIAIRRRTCGRINSSPTWTGSPRATRARLASNW